MLVTVCLNTECEEMHFPQLTRSQSREKELEGKMRLEELEEGKLKNSETDLWENKPQCEVMWKEYLLLREQKNKKWYLRATEDVKKITVERKRLRS